MRRQTAHLPPAARAPACPDDPRRALPQVTFHYQLITADEYDAAVLTAPRACPPFAMGDLRSGRQLLEDFDADARWTVRRLAGAARGSPALRRMAAALDALCGRLESRLQRRLAHPAGPGAAPAGLPYSAVLHLGPGPSPEGDTGEPGPGLGKRRRL